MMNDGDGRVYLANVGEEETEERLLLLGLAVLLPPALVLLVLLVLVLDQHEGDVLPLQRHRLQGKSIKR